MASGHMTTDEFFAGLTSLIETTQQKGHGSVYLTQKRLTYEATPRPASTKVADDPMWDLNPPEPLPLLVRASDGKTQNKDRVKNKDHKKISTIVQPDDVESFFTRYAEVCKTGMQSLRKRDRSKRKRDKGKKKKGGDGGEKKG